MWGRAWVMSCLLMTEEANWKACLVEGSLGALCVMGGFLGYQVFILDSLTSFPHNDDCSSNLMHPYSKQSA